MIKPAHRHISKSIRRIIVVALIILIIILINCDEISPPGTGNRNGYCSEYYTGGATC